jgi:hypothetical protein
LPQDLARIVGTSWRHNAANVSASEVITVDRPTQPGNAPRFGFVVAFGQRPTNNPAELRLVTFGPGTIDDNTFELFFIEQFPPGAIPSEVYAKVPRGIQNRPFTEVIPVNITGIDTSGAVLSAIEVPVAPGASVDVNGAAIVVARDFFEALQQRRVFIQLRGDFVPDVQTRLPVDADHLLGRLPTGDRVPGGTFWSWVQLR